MIDFVSTAVIIGSGLVILSIFTSLIAFRFGAPLLLVFLSIGLLAGEDGLLGLAYEDAESAYFIGSIALAIILFDSGFSTRFRSFRLAAAPAITLATVGVIITAGMVGLVAKYLLGLSWLEAFLLGAIVSSTDAAAVFFLLRVGGITLRERVKSTLEIESGTNDPMAIFLTIALVEALMAGIQVTDLTWLLLLDFVKQFGIGIPAGLVGGFVISQCVNRIEFDQGLYPILALALALLTFALASSLGGSGFLAVYIAGLLAGNRQLKANLTLYRFQLVMTWVGQLTMFLALGLFATPSQFLDVALEAAVLALCLMLIARPLAVWLCLAPFRFSLQEMTFIGWVGLRGAVSILLAIIPIIADLPVGQDFFNIAFLIVVMSLLLQGWTIPRAARTLGIVVPPRVGPIQRYELELPGKAKQELVAYRIHKESPVGLGTRIPRWARPSLIVRDGQSLRIHNAGRLQPGDMVYIFAAPQNIKLLDRLFAGRTDLKLTDRDFFGDFSVRPDLMIKDLAKVYGFEVKEADAERTLATLFKREFRDGMEIGDRMRYGLIELIVRRLDDEDQVSEVGVSIEPAETPARKGDAVRRYLKWLPPSWKRGE